MSLVKALNELLKLQLKYDTKSVLTDIYLIQFSESIYYNVLDHADGNTKNEHSKTSFCREYRLMRHTAK